MHLTSLSVRSFGIQSLRSNVWIVQWFGIQSFRFKFEKFPRFGIQRIWSEFAKKLKCTKSNFTMSTLTLLSSLYWTTPAKSSIRFEKKFCRFFTLFRSNSHTLNIFISAGTDLADFVNASSSLNALRTCSLHSAPSERPTTSIYSGKSSYSGRKGWKWFNERLLINHLVGGHSHQTKRDSLAARCEFNEGISMRSFEWGYSNETTRMRAHHKSRGSEFSTRKGCLPGPEPVHCSQLRLVMEKGKLVN